MKHTAALLAVLLLLALLPLPATSIAFGTPMGWVLHTDIVAYINGVPIQSYNIAGNTYVIAEDLARYGFEVQWRSDWTGDTLTIRPGSGIVTSDYRPTPNTHTPGEIAMPYLFTEILTYMGTEPVWAANIGGQTCVSMDDLAYFFGEQYHWDAEAGELRLTLRETYQIPGDYRYTYDTPGYAADTAVYGTYAMWEFTKTGNTFTLTDSAGATDFALQLELQDDRMLYREHFPLRPLGMGSTYFLSAPHILTASREIYETLVTQKLHANYSAEARPQHYRAYRLQNPAEAAALENLAAQATALWRVYINGEKISGIPETLEPGQYTLMGYRYQTYREFTYLYDHRIPLEQVETVRIELGTPISAALPEPEAFPDAVVRYATEGKCVRFAYIMKPFAEAASIRDLLLAPRSYGTIPQGEGYGFLYGRYGYVSLTDGQVALIPEQEYTLAEWLFSPHCDPVYAEFRDAHGCTSIEDFAAAALEEGHLTAEEYEAWRYMHQTWWYES